MYVDRSVRLGNLVYRARVMTWIRFDGYYIALLRYTYDAETHRPLASHYWTPNGQWIEYPMGGEFPPIPVPFFDWPQAARELVTHVADPEATKVLAQVIDAAEAESTKWARLPRHQT